MRVHSKAFTLVEFMLALVISTIIVALVVSVAMDHDQDQRAEEAAYAVTALRQEAEAAYSNNMGFMTYNGAQITGPTLFTYDKRFPRGVINTAAPGALPTAAQITNYWGGTFTVSSDSSVATSPGPCGGAARAPNDLLKISLTQVPIKACVQMASILAPKSYDTTINGTLVGLDPAPDAAGPGRRNVRYEQAGPLCVDAGNTLVFRSLKPLALNTLRGYPPTTNLTPTEAACTLPEYNRVQNALTAREDAQSAL